MRVMFCVLFSGALATSPCITLSRNETAVIDPSGYFSGDVAGIEVKSVGEHKAAIVKPHNATELFRMETEDSGSFGPSVQVNAVHFFTVLYSGKLEVWEANGHSINRAWEVTATVGKVVPLQTNEATGFVYWTQPDMELFFLNITLQSLSAKLIQGVDTIEAAGIIVCSCSNFVIVMKPSIRGSIFTYYKVDYTFSVAVKEDVEMIETLEEKLLDAQCELELFLLTSTTLLIFHKPKNIEFIHIPVSFGTVLSFYFQNLHQLLAVRTAEGSVVRVASEVVYLPGVLRVLQWKDTAVTLENIGSRLIITLRKVSSNRSTAVYQVVPLHQELTRTDDLLWLSNSYHQSALLLIKRGRVITGVIVDLSHSMLVVSSDASPYSFSLCAIDFDHTLTCAAITVIPQDYTPGDIVLESCSGDQSGFALSYPMRRDSTEALFVAESISGWNLRERLSFSALPSYLTCLVSSSSYSHEQIEVVAEEVDSSRFLCAAVIGEERSFLIFRNGNVVKRSQVNSSQLFSTSLSVISCALIRSNSYLFYAEDSEEGYLLVWIEGALEQYSLKSKRYISMQESDSHVLIHMEDCVQIVTFANTLCQRIEGQYIDIWVGEGKLVLRTSDFLEFYELWGKRYVLCGHLSLPAAISHFAISDRTLLLLHSNNTLAVYHLSGFSQLLFKFSVLLDCPVSFLIANESIAAYRCPTYIQLLLPSRKKNFLLANIIEVDGLSVWRKLTFNYFFEVQKKDNQWQFLSSTLDFDLDQLWIVIISFVEGETVSKVVSLQGQLEVANLLSEKSFTVNITLENHGGIIVPFRSSVDNIEKTQIEPNLTVEIPLGGRIILPTLDLFQGKEMIVSTKSTTNLIVTKVYGPITIQNYLIFPRTYIQVTVATAVNTLFAVDEFALIASRYECEEQLCKITSKRSTSLADIGVSFAFHLELMLSLGQHTFIRIRNQSVDTIVRYDSEQSTFTVVHRRPLLYVASNFYIIPRNKPSTFHLLLYSTVLEHCIAHAEAQINCTEVAEPGLVQVESVGGVKVSEECWHVYAVTRMWRLYTLLLCEELSILSVSSIRTSHGKELLAAIVAGSRLLVSTDTSSLIFSLPELSLLSVEPLWIIQDSYRRTQLWRVGSEESVRFITQISQRIPHLLDLTVSPHSIILAQIPLFNFQFTDGNCGFATDNNTAVIFGFSEGKVMLERRSTETGEGEVTITATNELSRVSVKVKVVLPGSRWELQVAAVGTVGMCLLGTLCRKKLQRRGTTELEMKRIVPISFQ